MSQIPTLFGPCLRPYLLSSSFPLPQLWTELSSGCSCSISSLFSLQGLQFCCFLFKDALPQVFNCFNSSPLSDLCLSIISLMRPSLTILFSIDHSVIGFPSLLFFFITELITVTLVCIYYNHSFSSPH